MKSIYLYILFFGLIVFSCETKWGEYGEYKMDYDSKLQYYIVLDKSDTFAISKGDTRENISPYPGAFLKLHNTDSIIDTCFFAKGAIVITTFVNEVKYDDNFILVDQTLLGKICECNPNCLKEKYGIAEPLTATTFELCEDALKKSDIHDYWIINKITDDVYGPYSKEGYLLKREKLKVPEDLKLKTE